MSSRRTFLAGTASAAALLAGCTVGYDPVPEPTPAADPSPSFTLELLPLSARTVGEAYLLDWDTLSDFQRGVLTNVLERGEWVGIDYEPVVRPGSLVDYGGRVHRIQVESFGERVVESALVTVEYDPDADWQAETLSGATPLAELSPVDRQLVELALSAFPPTTGPALSRSPRDIPEEGESRLRDGETVYVVHEGDGYRVRATGHATRTDRTYRYTHELAYETVTALGTAAREARAVATGEFSASERAFLSSATESRVDVTDGRYGRLYERLAEAPPAGPGLPPAVALDGQYYAARLSLR